MPERGRHQRHATKTEDFLTVTRVSFVIKHRKVYKRPRR